METPTVRMHVISTAAWAGRIRKAPHECIDRSNLHIKGKAAGAPARQPFIYLYADAVLAIPGSTGDADVEDRNAGGWRCRRGQLTDQGIIDLATDLAIWKTSSAVQRWGITFLTHKGVG